jgi:hypothetical protein
MENSKYLDAFNERFKDGIDDYVLIKGFRAPYNLINITRHTFVKFEDSDLAEYYFKKLLELNIPVYDKITDIPGYASW